MFAPQFYRSMSVASRWSQATLKHHLRRIPKLRISRLLLYFVLACILVLCSSSLYFASSENLSIPKNSKEKQAIERNEDEEEVKESVLQNSLINLHNYHLMISNSRLCAGSEKVKLLILVASSANHLQRRQAIRDTWGNSEDLSSLEVMLAFLLANPNDSKTQRKVVEEYRTYGDTIQEDFLESYMNLTLKSVMGIKWASNYCSKSTFVMKTDDDIFINVPSLIKYLESLEGNRFIAGCIKQKKSFQPVNAVPGMPQLVAHPLFAAGAGYVFSGSLLDDLYEASLRTRIIPVEDVYITGHLAKAVGAHPPIHDRRFSCGEMIMNDCDMTKVFTGHKITPGRMYKIWENINPNLLHSPCSYLNI